MLPGNPEFGDNPEESVGEPDQTTTNTAPPESNKPGRFCDKFARISKKFGKLTGALFLLVSLADIGNYYRTQNSVEISKDHEGNNVYRHPDPETTHILNYFAGREELRMEEIERNFREQLKFDFSSNGLSIPDDFDSYSIEQIDEWYMSVFPQHKKGDIQKRFAKYVKNIPVKITPSEDIYDFVWQLEDEVGNPKIRFHSPGKRIVLGRDKSYYSRPWHTLHIEMSRLKRDLLPELAHSKQFRGGGVSQYVESTLRGVRDFIKVGVRAISNADFSVPVIPIGPELEKTYDEPGSIEYEAHREIELDLRAKYGRIINLPKNDRCE